jgi:hypothetical protein
MCGQRSRSAQPRLRRRNIADVGGHYSQLCEGAKLRVLGIGQTAFGVRLRGGAAAVEQLLAWADAWPPVSRAP